MCIEVAADDGTRVLLDLGMPLQAPDGGDFPRDTPQRPTEELLAEGVLRDIPGVYPHDPTAPGVAAIILTHSHLDHYGLAHHAHPAIPVYGSEGTVAILEVGRVFFPQAKLPADLRRFPAGETLHFSGDRVIDGDAVIGRGTGGLTVTAIPVDHAAPDSRALLVEADGERLLYTGDLRAHGRTGFRFENLLADERVRGVDWLLVEGTTLGAGGGTHGLRSEAAVEEALVELARGGSGGPRGRGAAGLRGSGDTGRRTEVEAAGKLVAVAASGQNLDRLVSCFRAAKRSGRQLVVDAYQAYVLMQLAPLSPNIPQVDWDGVRVNFPPSQVAKLKDAGLFDLARQMSRQGYVSSTELAAHPGRFLICTRGSYGVTKLFDKVGSENVTLVWSMWRGYWERQEQATTRQRSMREWATRHAAEVHFVHSGGHAWPDDLARLVRALAPKHEPVWVHTDAALP
ncbi:MAG: MBL fold metallo-hydrolase [Thermoleophilia bacterium]|jgi:ribonuclease J|nr:MBL fold metallo-hydrolase [Thermoleophilia bacterium]